MRAANLPTPKETKEPGSRSGRITVVVRDQPAGHAPGKLRCHNESWGWCLLVVGVVGVEVNMNSFNFYDFDGAFFRDLLKVSTMSLFISVPKVTSACLRKPFEALLARGDLKGNLHIVFGKDSLCPWDFWVSHLSGGLAFFHHLVWMVLSRLSVAIERIQRQHYYW